MERQQLGQRGRGPFLRVTRWLTEVPDAIHAVHKVLPLRETALAHVEVEAHGKIGTVLVGCE
ncbi:MULTISPECIES: hypothetical protein [Cupriavidus]|uniref:hypothetical protein n=1 Tax=Cupriavidus sp. DF5525 TaxID=3160989 RepID=UPI0032DF4948